VHNTQVETRAHIIILTYYTAHTWR